MVSVHKQQPNSNHSKHAKLAMPVAHLLALAPIDVWLRMLYGQWIHPRYWIRLLGIGFTSIIGTIWSLPERILFGLGWWFFNKTSERFDHLPGVLVVVGYYRSGTTHAHNLLACNPNSVTPRWYQALLGQGFTFSWAVTRFLLVPFLGSSRPQDGVGFGPHWPAEDDFALAGWGMCSTLPGRLIFPHQWDRWKKWNTLEDCSEAERSRWRRTIAGFAWKVTRRNQDKLLILKTPSHGAHITELVKVFGHRVRFLHVRRDPTQVIESNMRMHHALSSHLLQDPLDSTVLRDRIVHEYLDIERATIMQSQALDEGRISFVSHEQLIRNPIKHLQESFQTLGLDFTDAHSDAIIQYLASLGTYQQPTHPTLNTGINLGTPSNTEPDAIAELLSLRPAGPTPTEPPPRQTPAARILPQTGRGAVVAVGVAIAWGIVWLGLIWFLKQLFPDYRPRLDQLVWIGGSVIGVLAFKSSGGGSKSLGIVAAMVTLVVFVAVSFPITVINWHFAQGESLSNFLYHNTKGALHGLLAPSSIIYAILGSFTAYRHASDTGPKAPGI